MGSSYSVQTVEVGENKVVRVTLYYTPLDPRCLEHLQQFLELQARYKSFTIFKAINAVSDIKLVPDNIAKLPLYVIERNTVIATASPNGHLLEHTLQQLITE